MKKNRMGLFGMGWDGMGWDGMGRVGMAGDGIGWGRKWGCAEVWVLPRTMHASLSFTDFGCVLQSAHTS